MTLTVREILQREDFFDAAIMWHGFTDYLRDYTILVTNRNASPPEYFFRYQFIGCVEANYRSRIAPPILARSLSDTFVYAGPEYPEQPILDGFVWGVRYSTAYPGLEYVEASALAQRWSIQLGRPMHEVVIETEAFWLQLVFADVRFAEEQTELSQVVLRHNPLPVIDPTRDGGVT